MTGSFSSCGTPKEWVGLGVFGLGLWFSLSNFGRRWCFRKVCSVGLYLRKTFWSCSPHMPQAWTQQTPAPRKSRAFYLCDWFHPGIFLLSLPRGSRCDALVFWMQVTCPWGAAGDPWFGPPTTDRWQWLWSLMMLAGFNSAEERKKP